MTRCCVDGCEKPRKRGGSRYCSMHLARIERHGSPDVVKIVHGRLRDRVEAKIDRTDPAGCWLWTGATDEKGYGGVCVDRTRRWARAHRVVYELLVGPVPDGLELDHTCAVRHCVNPAHLEPVTHAENIRRTWARRR